MGVGHCLGPEGNGVSLGEGGKGGPGGPPGGRKDKQSVLSKGRDNMGKDEKDWASHTWWRRISANRVSGFPFTRWKDHIINVIMIAESILISCFCFRRMNHMALKNHWSSVYTLLYITSRKRKLIFLTDCGPDMYHILMIQQPRVDFLVTRSVCQR